MRHQRSLTDEELALLSEPVDRPTAEWDTFQETGQLRPVESSRPEGRVIGGPWAAFHGVEELPADTSREADDNPWYPRWGEIRKHFWPSAGRLYDEVLGYVSPQILFDRYAGFTEQQREIGSLVSDAARSLFSFDVSPHFLTGSEIGTLPTTPEEDLSFYRSRLESQFPHTAPSMPGYDDPKVAEELELRELKRKYPSLTQMSEGLQALTPVHPERGWQGTQALSRMVEQEPFEFALDIGLSATGIGVGAAGVRGTVRGFRVARRAVSPLEDIGDALSDIDVLTGELSPVGRLRRSTVDIEVQGTRSWDLQNLSRFGRRRRELGTGVLVSPTEIVTASHTLTGKTDAAFPNIERITATIAGGQRIDVGTISGLSPEADIAVLDLPDSVDAPLLDIAGDIDDFDVLYGKSRIGEGYDSGTIGREIARDPITGAALRETSYVGRGGLSGAGLATERGQLAGIYLGTYDDVGMFADASTVQRFLEEDRPTFDVQDFDRSWHRQRLMDRALYNREGAEIGLGVRSLDALSTFGSQYELQSRDPDDDWRGSLLGMLEEMEQYRRVDERRLALDDIQSAMYEGLGFSQDATLAEMFRAVEKDPELFFYVGRRGVDVEDRAYVDRGETKRYRRWEEAGSPVDEFDFEKSSRLVPAGQFLSAEGVASQHPHVVKHGVFGYGNIEALGQHLRQVFEKAGDVPLDDYSLQLVRGRPSEIDATKIGYGDVTRRSSADFLPGAQGLLEFDLPSLDVLRDVYSEVRGMRSHPRIAEGLSWIPDPTVTKDREGQYIPVGERPSTVVVTEQLSDEMALSRIQIARGTPEGMVVEPMLFHAEGRAKAVKRKPMHEWTHEELSRETLVGESYWVRQARAEMFRRRFESAKQLSERLANAPPGQRIPVSYGRALQSEIARDFAAAKKQSETWDSEYSFETDIAAAHAAEGARDHTEAFNPQDYKSESWEPVGGYVADDDKTGQFYEGWVDEHGDFQDVWKEGEEIEKQELDVFLEVEGDDYTEPVAVGWIDEYGTHDPGMDTPAGIDANKLAVDVARDEQRRLSPESQLKIWDMFSGYIERREYEQKLLTEGDPELEAEIIARMDVRDPDWRRKMRVASRADRSVQSPGLRPYWEQAVAEQPSYGVSDETLFHMDIPREEYYRSQRKHWQVRADELWYGGQFEEYYHHVEPVRERAYQLHRQARDAESADRIQITVGEKDTSAVYPESDVDAQKYHSAAAMGVYLPDPPAAQLAQTGVVDISIPRHDRRFRDETSFERAPDDLVLRGQRQQRYGAEPMDIFMENILWKEAGIEETKRIPEVSGVVDEFVYASELDEDVVRYKKPSGAVESFNVPEAEAWHRSDIEEGRLARPQYSFRDSDTAPPVDVFDVYGLTEGTESLTSLDLATLGSVRRNVLERYTPRRVWEAAQTAEYRQAARRPIGQGIEEGLTADELRDIRLRGEQIRAERAFNEATAEGVAYEAEARRTAQAGAYRMQEDPAAAGAREAVAEEFRQERERADKAFRKVWDESKRVIRESPGELPEEIADPPSKIKRRYNLHSLPWEDVEPLDLDTPRARLAGFGGIESERTYGLEIELITDLTRADMERELEWQMAQGLSLKYDLSLRTARSEVALEHHPPAHVQFSRMHLPGEIQRAEAADYERYRSQFTGMPGEERIRPEDFETRYAHELVFPVMQGEEGLELIGQTVRRLQEFETELNTSMGMHVHVGAQDLSNYDLVGIWGAFAAREDVIDLMHEPSRRGQGSAYAETLVRERGEGSFTSLGELLRAEMRGGDLSQAQPVSELERMRSRLETARRRSLLSSERREGFLDQVGYGHRYQKLNLRGFEHQTIEYRQPAPTLDVSEIEHHIGFITNFVDEFSGKPLEWAMRQDPRLQQEYAGLDLVFERPDETGQLLLFPETRTELHSADELTPSQRQAMEHTYGAAAVIAGPGSGKSRTLLERLRYLTETIDEQSGKPIARPEDILTLVFGKEAEKDLIGRGGEFGGPWNIFTVDAFARGVVRENFGELGYARAPDISTSTFEDWLSGKQIPELGLSGVGGDGVEAWAKLYEETRRGFTTGREDYSALPEGLQGAIRDYRLERFHAAEMDFTDAISQAGYLLETNEALRQRYQDRFEFLQVDEFQDISPIQWRFLQNLSPNPWVVGDLDQGIMSFRGGTGTVMREMIESGVSLYNIEENFRSTPEIVTAAQGFIRSNLDRLDVSQSAVKPSGEPVMMVGVSPLTTEQQAIARIAEHVREGEETAILTATNREKDVFEHELAAELRGRGWEDQQIKDHLTFSTMHSAKGREWQNVFLPINLLESDFGNTQRLFTLPSPYARTPFDFAEQERVFYVAMTRAQERLTIFGDPQHPYYEQVTRAISGVEEGAVPSYLEPPDDVPEAAAASTRGGLGGFFERFGSGLDRFLHGDPTQRTPRREGRRRARTKTELHSVDEPYREGSDIPGLDQFLDVADRHPGIFYRFESDDPSGYVSQDLAQTHAILREHEGQANLLPDSFMVPEFGKYDTLIRPAGQDRWSLYDQQHEQVNRGEREGTFDLYREEYDRETDDFEFVYSGPVEIGYVGRRGLYGHVDRSSFVEVSLEVLGFRASQTPLQLSETDRHFSVHYGTSTPFRQYIGDLSEGEDVFMSHGVLARLPVNLDTSGSYGQQRYAVNPNLGEFIEAGNVNLNWLAQSIEALPQNVNADRIWGDYLAGQQGSELLGLERAVEGSRQWLEGRHRGAVRRARSRRVRTDLHSLDDSDDINAKLNDIWEDEQNFYDANFALDPPTPVEANPDILFGTDPTPESAPESVPDILFESELESFASDISAAHKSVMSVELGRGLGLGQRLSRWFSEAVEERAWGGLTHSAANILQDAATINVAASLAVEGVRTAVGHDLNIGSLIHAGASTMAAMGAKAVDARFGSRGVLPEARADLGALADVIQDVPEDAAVHLQRIFEEAGAGTSRWRRGSLADQLERYDWSGLESMFGESGAAYLDEFAYQTRRFGQRSYGTQRNWQESLLDIYAGGIPRATRYTYDPKSGEVDFEMKRRWTLDRLLEAGSDRYPHSPIGAWHARREQLREDPRQDMLRHVFGPLQGEDVRPHELYMLLPEARGIGRLFGRFHRRPDNDWVMEDIVRGVGATRWVDRIAERKEFRREHQSILEERRRSPELYQWQDPAHFYGKIAESLGIDTSDFEGFGERLGSPYSEYGRFFSRLPKAAKYPVIGGGAAVGGKLGYELFFGGDDDEELVLDDPAGYSLSARYPILGAVQRTLPYRRLRARAENLLDDVYGEDSFHSEMLKSIGLGKKGNLPWEVKQTFVQTGQIHALVQSGMHVSTFSNILSRYPLLAAPAAFSAARDVISPPDERVVEPSQSFWSKYQLSPDPWIPRWNPEPPTSGQISALQSQGLLADDYELEIPEPPSWAWWDPVENYRRDEEVRGQKLATEGQVDLLGSLGLLPEGYDPSVHEPSEISLNRGQPGIQDVLPWSVYGMFGVLPETGFSYFRSRGDIQRKDEEGNYRIDGFEFDVQESPFPGFNPWLDPHPEGILGESPPAEGSFDWDFGHGLLGIGVNQFAGVGYGIGGGIPDPDAELLELYKELGIDPKRITREDASKLIEYQKKQREAQGNKATEKQIVALTKMYPGKDLSKLTKEQASELFDAYEPPPKMASDAQLTALKRMYPDKDLSGLTMAQASELFDAYEPPPKMATEVQKAALTRMYPDKDLSGLTMVQASELFDTYERPARSQDATQAQLDYLDRLRGGGFGDVMPIEDVDESDGLTRQEVSALIDFEKAKRRSAEISRESAGPTMATESQLRYLGQLNPERYGGLSGATEDVMGIEDVTFDDGITALEARTLFDYEDAVRKSRESAGPAMASDAQLQVLQRMFPDQFGASSGVEVEEPPMMGIEEITFDDGITRREAAALFDYGEAVQKSAGPPMASEAQIAALQRYFPQMFEPTEQAEEEPLVPLGQIDFTDGVTREEARQAFRHVPEMPPPMATQRQIDRLEMEFPHAFRHVGRVDQYLQTGQSYGVVKSLEDIYDADTFTGMLFDAPTGQLFKEDTVRLGDFNAPEIKPDPSKPLEYQEREAARAREARDVFRSMVQRFNIGRDVDQEGYVIPIQYRHDAQMLGGLARGKYGRVLGDVDFEGVDYEQFMIQQGMGSVYGASVEWGAREIDPLELWRRSPTFLEQFGEGTTGLLWQIPEVAIGGVFQGMDPFDALTETVAQVPGALKDMAIGQAKQTLTQATKDFFKERFTDEFTPNNLSFAQRYIGDFGGVGEKVGVFKDKAAGFLQSGWGAAIAPAALAAGTAIIGERSLDMNYAEVIPTREDRVKAFDHYVSQRQESTTGGAMSSDDAALRVIKKALREVLSESGLGSMDDLSTKLDRKLRESDRRGITRPR